MAEAEDDADLPRPPTPLAMYPADLVEAVVTRLDQEIRQLRADLADVVARLDASAPPAPREPQDTRVGTDPFTEFLDVLHRRVETPEPDSGPQHDPTGNDG